MRTEVAFVEGSYYKDITFDLLQGQRTLGQGLQQQPLAYAPLLLIPHSNQQNDCKKNNNNNI